MATQTGDKQADSVNEALKSNNDTEMAANTQNKQSVTKQDSIVSGSKLADANPEEKTKTSAEKKEKVAVDGNNEKGADGGSNLIAK